MLKKMISVVVILVVLFSVVLTTTAQGTDVGWMKVQLPVGVTHLEIRTSCSDEAAVVDGTGVGFTPSGTFLFVTNHEIGEGDVACAYITHKYDTLLGGTVAVEGYVRFDGLVPITQEELAVLPDDPVAAQVQPGGVTPTPTPPVNPLFEGLTAEQQVLLNEAPILGLGTDPRFIHIDDSRLNMEGYEAFGSQYPIRLEITGVEGRTGLGVEMDVDYRVNEPEFGVIQGKSGTIPGIGDVGAETGCFVIWIIGPAAWETQVQEGEFPPMTLREASWESYKPRGVLSDPIALFNQKVLDLRDAYPDTCGAKGVESWLFMPEGLPGLVTMLGSGGGISGEGWTSPEQTGVAGMEDYVGITGTLPAPAWQDAVVISIPAGETLLFAASQLVFSDTEGNVVASAGGELNCSAAVVVGPWTGTVDIISGKVEHYAVTGSFEAARALNQKAADLVANDTNCAEGIETLLFEQPAQ